MLLHFLLAPYITQVYIAVYILYVKMDMAFSTVYDSGHMTLAYLS